jgi:hypothetical protein
VTKVAWALIGVGGGLIVAVAALAYRDYARYSSRDVPVWPPLANAFVSETDGVTTEIFATLAPGVRLERALKLDIFEGFEPGMTPEAAAQALGPPSGEWDDPFCLTTTGYYQRPAGRVSVCRYPTEGGHSRTDIVGFPTNCQNATIFRDDALSSQLMPLLPATGEIHVNILRQVGWGGATISMSRRGCSWLMLSERDAPSDDASGRTRG